MILWTCFLVFHLFRLHSCAPSRRATGDARPSIDADLAKLQNPWELSGLFEGDIILTKVNRNVMSSNHWPNGEIPYEISPNFNEREKFTIRIALVYLAAVTCIKPRPRTKSDNYGILISEEPGFGCSSKVGFWRGNETVHLDPKLGCVRGGVVIHELLHVLGFWHQQSAAQRDLYIDVLWDNITPGTENNFEKATTPTTSFGLEYDYGSIMHYSEYAFSHNKKKTIVPKQPNAKIGQRERLSPTDIQKIKYMYCP